MILDQDKKEEEAARDRPQAYIRAHHNGGSVDLAAAGEGSTPSGIQSRDEVEIDTGSIDSVEAEGLDAGISASGVGVGSSASHISIIHATDLEASQRERRRERRRWQAVFDARDETTRLLPPTYREATIGLDKRRRRRMWVYILLGVLVVGSVIVGTEMVDDWMYRKKLNTGDWIRGGLDGKGAYDPDWSFHYPLQRNETSLRQCDLFSDPVPYPPWAFPSTADQLYWSVAIYKIPSTAKNIMFHSRGSNIVGEVTVISSDQPSWMERGSSLKSDWREDKDDIVVVVKVTAAQASTISHHSCLFGSESEGNYGVILLGRPDGGPPVDSPWLSGYIIWSITVYLPQAKEDESEIELGRFEFKMENMGFSMYGDLVRERIVMEEFSLGTSNYAVSIGTIATKGEARVRTSKGTINIRNIFSPLDIVLWNTGAIVYCENCTAGGSILLSGDGAARISGTYKASNAIDLATSDAAVMGNFEAPRLWVETSEGNIKGVFSGIRNRPGKDDGGMVLTTTTGDIDIVVVCSPEDLNTTAVDLVTSGLDEILQYPRIQDYVKIVIASRAGDISVDLKTLPPTSPIILSLTSGDGSSSAKIPDNYLGEVKLRPPRNKKAFIGWLPGRIRGRREVVMNRDGKRERTGVLSWDGPVQGNITSVVVGGKDRGVGHGMWNQMEITSSVADVKLGI